jgi:hypothetical protein
VVIRRSSLGEVQQLLAEIREDDPVGREAAVARLRVIGDRAIRHVLEALADPPGPAAHVALLRVLEGRHDAGLPATLERALAGPAAEVRVAAVTVARGLLAGEHGAAILDRLIALALNRDEPITVRLAAIAALHELPQRTVAPVLATLARDSEPAIRLASAPRADGSDEPGADLADAAAGRLPADPQRLMDALARDGEQAALPTLHRLVTVLREIEPDTRGESRRRDWLAVRGAVHQILARRSSRVALYDLRETIEHAGDALPGSFVTAIGAIGDASCLETIGAAYMRAAEDMASNTWRVALADAARAIVRREKLTGRHQAVRRLRTRWGPAVDALWR